VAQCFRIGISEGGKGMRKIKFRAWDGKSMRYDVTGFEHDDELGIVGVFIDGNFYSLSGKFSLYPKAAVMQYTGLKDKNGVKIYEGDIVTYLGHEVKNGKQIRPEKTILIGKDWPYDIYRMNNLMSVENTFKVIGNIHQNPELMEEKE
jgi:hypothetical protein